MLRPNAFAIPAAPLILTLAGLIPFIAAAALIVASGGDVIRQAQAKLVLLVYGAVILSFLGGVRWGIEIGRGMDEAPRFLVLTGAVLGALFGWAIVLYAILGEFAATLFLAMALGLVVHWAWDLRAGAPTPPWYGGLRTLATAGATASMLAAWWEL